MEVGRDRLILVTSGAQAAQFMLNGMLNAFLPLYGRDVLNLTALQLGWLFGFQTLATLAGSSWHRLSFGPRRTAVGHCDRLDDLQCGGLLAVSYGHGAGASSPRSSRRTRVENVAMTTAATSAYITDVTRRARYGAAHGVFGTIYDVGDALGPISAGGLSRCRVRLCADVSR